MLVVVVCTVVIASVVMNTALGPKIVIPGPLTAQHALLTADCTHCHSAEMDSTKGILHGMINSELSLRDSVLCLDCHDLGADAMLAHGMSHEAMEQRVSDDASGTSQEGFSGFAGIPPPHSADGEYACAVCHVEHEGRRNDLTSMSEAQCQACHEVEFSSFHSGHPTFDGYPYERRLRIQFDHASHIYHNFLTKDPTKAPVACTDCHSADPSGDFMMTAPFEVACAKCHGQEVRAAARSEGSGVVFFALPAIDTMTLEDEGVDIGQWPADSAITESPISPYVRLLLQADPLLRDDLVVLDSLDLLDLQGATGGELVAVARVAWAIKSIALVLAQDGHAGLLVATADAIGADDMNDLSPHLAGGLSGVMLKESIGAWFPDLEDELKAHAKGNPPATDPRADAVFEETESSGQEWASLGGWYRDDMAFAIRLRPTGHGDAFLKAWADLAAANPGSAGAILDSMTAVDAVGRCLSCHSVDEVGTGADSLQVNWYARRAEGGAPDLTRFSHGPHLPLVGDDGCLQCHSVDPQSREFEMAFGQYDPGVFVSSLAPMDQAACAECHAPEKVTTTCLGCHDYHAHRPGMRLRAGAPLKPISSAVQADSEPDSEE